MSTINLENELLLLPLKLHNNSIISRNVVQIFIESLKCFINETFIKYLSEQLKHSLRKYGNSVFQDIEDILNSSKLIFDKFETEHQRFGLYQTKGLMIMPVEHKIGTTIVNKYVRDELHLQEENVYELYIPLKWSLKLLLELPGMFEQLTNYMENLKRDKSTICNFIQADIWNEHYEEYTNLIPLFVYEDDFETGNALGSHAGKHKLGAVYTSIACLPPQIASQLNNILLTILFNAKDRKTYGNERIFGKLIDELNELRRDGLQIQVNSKVYNVYFQLCLILGDNLGLNEILGFQENFAHGRPCRVCKADIDQIKILTVEEETLIRTVDSYDKDCEKKNVHESGIKEMCVFNNVHGFHVCRNMTLDLMHDLFEGVTNYTMINILDEFIYKQKLFSIEFLNNQIDTFQYGPLESSNKIPNIKKEHIQTSRKLKMSSTEMICFSRYFGLLVGEKVNEGNNTWELYILFRKIIALVTCPVLEEEHIFELDILISEFLLLYKELYGCLKYKFHCMTHIARIIKRNGPLVHYWSMRYESKHRQLKLSANITSNRKNLKKTLAIKNQLQLAYLRVNKSSVFANTFGKFKTIDESLRNMYFPDCRHENIVSTNQAEVNGIQYSIDMIFVIKMSDNDVNFGKVLNIFVKQNCTFLLMQRFTSVYFDDHYFAYNVKLSKKWILKDINDLVDTQSCLLINKKECTLIATRYAL